jgi:hypothetical protein
MLAFSVLINILMYICLHLCTMRSFTTHSWLYWHLTMSMQIVSYQFKDNIFKYRVSTNSLIQITVSVENICCNGTMDSAYRNILKSEFINVTDHRNILTSEFINVTDQSLYICSGPEGNIHRRGISNVHHIQHWGRHYRQSK